MSDTELLPKPKAGSEPEVPVRRVEVFTGTGRRRRWTPEQKALIVAETYESGETVSAVARRHGLTTQQLFTWRRNGRRACGDESRIAFAPVVLETSRSHGVAAPLAQDRPGGSPVIEIVIGAATVRIPPGIELATLQLVLRAVATTAS
jgi:transposase